MMKKREGIPASTGFAIGQVKRVQPSHDELLSYTIEDREAEKSRFLRALDVALGELNALIASMRASSDEGQTQLAAIFDAHREMLQDPLFIDGVKGKIEAEAINAEAAIVNQREELAAIFEAMDNDYMRQRAADIRDICQRLLTHLTEKKLDKPAAEDDSYILVTHDLHPSDTVTLNPAHILGFITEIGGKNSHTAIMARTKGIPAVVGIVQLLDDVSDGDWIILDGESGTVILEPDESTLNHYHQLAEQFAQKKAAQNQVRFAPSCTKDGHLIELAANIGMTEEAESAMAYGADGIGLFRSEFLYMHQATLPSEEEQFIAYRNVVQTMKGRPVIIRTLDIGGDKSVASMDLPHEENPFLGYRAIRICLDRSDLFLTQLRAILRASAFGKIRIMYPMISSLYEVQEAKKWLAIAKDSLRKEGIAFDPSIEQGIMIEIPSAAVIADIIAPEVDFFSIGTNDLIQYTMAADRMNEKVTAYYNPYHPAIVRLIAQVIQAAHQHGKWVGVCGEMASDPHFASLFIGMGIDELSMSPPAILAIRAKMQQQSLADLQKIASQIRTLTTSEAIYDFLQAAFL